MRPEIERLIEATAFRDKGRAGFKDAEDRVSQAIADLEAVMLPEGYVAVSRSMAMRLIRDGGHLTNAELIDLRMELTQAPTDAESDLDLMTNAAMESIGPALDYLGRDDAATAECPETVMPRVNGKPFRCECGCNVFTKLDNFYRCNACSLEYEGTGVASTEEVG